MATLASTQVTGSGLGLPVSLGPLNVEIWRVAGGAVGDTVAITPNRGRFVVAAIGEATSNALSSLGTNTNVTLTLIASMATNVTFDVMILVAP